MVGVWSIWCFSFLALLYPFHPKFVAQAEITSPKASSRFHRLEVTPLEAGATRKPARVKVSPKVDNSSDFFIGFKTESVFVDVLGPSNDRQMRKDLQSGLGKEAHQNVGTKTAPNSSKRLLASGKKYDNIFEDSHMRIIANIRLENTFPNQRKRTTRSVGAEYAEILDRNTNGEGQSRERFLETAQGIANSRAEYRRTGEDARGSNPRQSEPHLDTSTFALSGDSAHNQAMVHWSGHNSSVILILTKLYDFNLGAVTESSLWRSVDYGSTYTKIDDKVGSRTVLSYLYVCPTNKRKIMMLSDPEIESAVLISSDEGASFEKHPINFYIQSLLFHPVQENWILAYSHDSKLYSSMDFGRKWQLVHDDVMPGRFYWAVMGLDRESDVVHIETRIAKGREFCTPVGRSSETHRTPCLSFRARSQGR